MFESSKLEVVEETLRAQAIELLNTGPTGTMGRHGFNEMFRAHAEVLAAEEAKITTTDRSERASAGMFFHGIKDYLNAETLKQSGRPPKFDRAETLLNMFENADQGIVGALSMKVFNDGILKMVDIQHMKPSSLDCYEAIYNPELLRILRGREKYKVIRDFWKPRLEIIRDSSEDRAEEILASAEKEIGPKSSAWGLFINDLLHHMKEALILQGNLDGIILDEFEDLQTIPFRWHVFNPSKPAKTVRDRLSIARAALLEPIRPLYRRGELWMLDIDGLLTPKYFLKDALYRINMVSAYDTFMMSFGDVEFSEDQLMPNTIGSIERKLRSHNDKNSSDIINICRTISAEGHNLIGSDLNIIDPILMLKEKRHAAARASEDTKRSILDSLIQEIENLALSVVVSFDIVDLGKQTGVFLNVFSRRVYTGDAFIKSECAIAYSLISIFQLSEWASTGKIFDEEKLEIAKDSLLNLVKRYVLKCDTKVSKKYMEWLVKERIFKFYSDCLDEKSVERSIGNILIQLHSILSRGESSKSALPLHIEKRIEEVTLHLERNIQIWIFHNWSELVNPVS